MREGLLSPLPPPDDLLGLEQRHPISHFPTTRLVSLQQQQSVDKSVYLHFFHLWSFFFYIKICCFVIVAGASACDENMEKSVCVFEKESFGKGR